MTPPWMPASGCSWAGPSTTCPSLRWAGFSTSTTISQHWFSTLCYQVRHSIAVNKGEIARKYCTAENSIVSTVMSFFYLFPQLLYWIIWWSCRSITFRNIGLVSSITRHAASYWPLLSTGTYPLSKMTFF